MQVPWSSWLRTASVVVALAGAGTALAQIPAPFGPSAHLTLS